MSIEFKGLDDVLAMLDKPVEPEKLERALLRACLVVERAAKQKAPKGTGELQRSITSKVEDRQGIVYTPLEYAPYVEYGTGLFAEEGGRKDVPWCYQDDEGNWHSTSGMPPRPYMRPALDENREEVLRVLREGLLDD
jgi:HK97 gp10 family phage protein